MSMMSVGSLSVLNQRRKKDLGGMALKRLAPKAALQGDVGLGGAAVE
jgi:hypothetical protein